MFNLDRGIFNLREFPLLTDLCIYFKRLFEGMLYKSLSILNVSIRSPRCLLRSKVVRFTIQVFHDITNEIFQESTWLLCVKIVQLALYL